MLHFSLVAVFAHNAEHRIIISLDSTDITIALSVSLQLFYIVCSSKLDFASS